MTWKRENDAEAAGASGGFNIRDKLWELIAGFVVLAILLAILLPNYFEASTRSPISQERADMRILLVAIEAYGVDHNVNPASATGKQSINGSRFKHPDLQRLPSFRIPDTRYKYATLTTPVAYMTSYPKDVFAPQKGATFVYYDIFMENSWGWILIGAGPDRKYDIDPAGDFNPSIEQPSPQLLAQTYDPTNGAASGGDIWILRQQLNRNHRTVFSW